MLFFVSRVVQLLKIDSYRMSLLFVVYFYERVIYMAWKPLRNGTRDVIRIFFSELSVYLKSFALSIKVLSRYFYVIKLLYVLFYFFNFCSCYVRLFEMHYLKFLNNYNLRPLASEKILIIARLSILYLTDYLCILFYFGNFMNLN